VDDKCCEGGMWWGPCTRYKNAVTTELFVDCSIGMYEIYGNKRDSERAVRGWIWFKHCGMITVERLVNDGLTQDGRSPPEFAVPYLPPLRILSLERALADGMNNGQTTWTHSTIKELFSPDYRNYTNTQATHLSSLPQCISSTPSFQVPS
jgi:hypothetical protein